MKKILLYAAVPALLLVGCTKETAEPEVSTPQVKGTSTIIADYVSDSETRTVMGGDANYHWSSGDAIGVFNAEAGDRSNVRFRFTDENIFKGDMEFLGDEAYYAYYPQVDGKKITEDETIEINLSNSQNFNFERKDQVVGPVKGSFADGVVPSVAYGEATDENTLQMTFRPAASYIIVPVTGNGKVTSLTMTAPTYMAGTLSIDLTALKKIESDQDQLANDDVTLLSSGRTKSIEVYCGKNGVTLDPKEPTYFWFAVAPGVQANGTYKFKFNTDDSHVKTVEYKGSANEQKTGTTPFTNVGKVRLLDTVDWTDTTLPLPVESEWEFIIYAYASAYDINDDANNILNLKAGDGTLRPAHITRDLDFANAEIPEEEELPIDMSNSWLKKVLNKYKTNAEDLSGVSGAVTSLGGVLEYEIIGAKEGAKQTYIRNLSVKAPAVANTANTAGIFGGKGDVKDIRIEKANVYNSNPSIKGVASFLTNIVANHKFENVTINGGTLTAEASIFAIVPELTATQAKNAADAKVVTVASYPKANKTTVLPYANKFTVNNDVTFDKKNENNALNTKLLVKATETAFDKFNTISASSTGYIVTVDTDADLAAAVNALATPAEGANAKLSQSTSAWLSIMGADGTSYWTGFAPTATRSQNKNTVTAEDLARVVKAGNGTVNMTNDINLSNLGDKWIDVLPTVYATASVVDINGKDSDEKIHTISNIKLSPKQMTVTGGLRADGAYAKSLSLFGAVANLANVKISGITIEDTNLEEGVPTFGLASMTKSVENVVIENFRVNISHPNPEIPVGLFGTVPATAVLKNIETNAAIYWGTGYDSVVAAKVARGVIAGELVCGKDTQTYDGLTVTGMSQYANKPFGKITVKLEQGYNTYELIFTNFVGNEEALSASTAPVQFEDAAIPTGAEVSFVTMVNGTRDYRTYTKK